MRALPDGFLGGYSPRLLELRLEGILFPALPKLLSSTSDLVKLHLTCIPISGCISPEVMANCLSMLPKLKSLTITFKRLIHFPDQRRPSPLPRAVLPTLTTFSFKGNSEYLEDFVFRIDAPLLVSLRLRFFDQPMIDIRQLSQFIRHTEIFGSVIQARLYFGRDPYIRFRPTNNEMMGSKHRTWLSCRIACNSTDEPLLSMAQICNQLSPILFNLKSLSIFVGSKERWSQDGTDPAEWLGLFRTFTAVETLYVSKELGPHVAPALEDLSRDPAMAVLLKLRCLQFGSSRKSTSVNQFITARGLSEFGHPITVEYDKKSPRF
ncbi:hypothetical protein B0F90DRAFT_1926377 [Multifurca ochricompacta]|uniref:F-box domain-containing protein n=1 Tax=Multifurca ochricompacta TaxID=376703 RepID=A0AAD4M1L1_9AGAM|nr:hypothetical protein B0F90DRAFT_1926377 [Multifurca ochricompacta]